MPNVLFKLEKGLTNLFNKKSKTVSYGVTKTIHRNDLQDLMMDCRKEMTVTFIKKDGAMRTMTGIVEPHKNHTGINPAAHIGKYVTLTENHSSETPKFRNINLHTVQHLSVGLDTFIVHGELTGK